MVTHILTMPVSLEISCLETGQFTEARPTVFGGMKYYDKFDKYIIQYFVSQNILQNYIRLIDNLGKLIIVPPLLMIHCFVVILNLISFSTVLFRQVSCCIFQSKGFNLKFLCPKFIYCIIAGILSFFAACFVYFVFKQMCSDSLCVNLSNIIYSDLYYGY